MAAVRKVYRATGREAWKQARNPDHWHRACLTRAADRRNLCIANKGQSDREPLPWSEEHFPEDLSDDTSECRNS